MLATVDGKEMALNNVLQNSDINLENRQPQQHCGKREKKVLVEVRLRESCHSVSTCNLDSGNRAAVII
jgi:hypothetical protein